jgi:hypothetical protein
MKIGSIIFRAIVFLLLTVITQVGGIIYLLSLLTHKYINKKASRRFYRVSLKFASFLLLYCIASFLIVPVIAKPFGRTALPLTENGALRPLNFLTCFLNRHYVRPALKQTAYEVAAQMSNKYPGTVVNYLEANFPFFNGFPLIPHLSHNDGSKLDIAFCYIDKETGEATNETPSIIGYGINEGPAAGEVNTAIMCAEKGNWQYSFLTKMMPQGNKANFSFDATRTKDLVGFFASNPATGKIFIEPHLKTRLKLHSDKVRFHGCQAVRHDDHIHIQLK